MIETALTVKTVLDKAGAACYCKTSGASGLHVYIPMGARYTYDQVKQFGEIIAFAVQQHLPDLTSIERSLKKEEIKSILIFFKTGKDKPLLLYTVPGQNLMQPYQLRLSGKKLSLDYILLCSQFILYLKDWKKR